MPDGSPASASPRRSPRCKKCHQPRKGHPRSGCPAGSAPTTEEAGDTPPLDDSDDLRSRHALAEQRRRRLSAPPVAAQHTFSSLATELSNPRIPDDKKAGLDQRIERWRAGVEGPPTEYEPAPTQPNSPETKPAKLEEEEDAAGLSTPRRRDPKPLLRSMSAEERLLFLEGLKHSTKQTAQVFIMDRSEVQEALRGARKQGFHGGVCLPTQGDALLVLGMDKEAVDTLLQRVRSEQGSPLRNRVAGAMAGAAAMWTALAYS